jgi:hypothetical protein
MTALMDLAMRVMVEPDSLRSDLSTKLTRITVATV